MSAAPDLALAVSKADVIQLYQAADGYRWRYLVAGIGGLATITADGGQGYSNRYDAVHGAARVVGVSAELLMATARGDLKAVGRSSGLPGDDARSVTLLVDDTDVARHHDQAGS